VFGVAVNRKTALIGHRAALALAILTSRQARADDAAPSAAPVTEEPNRDVQRQRLLAMTRPGPQYDFFGTAMVGDGLRFNNPFRLSHELGSNGESLSTTAPYLDLAVGATFGKARGVEHGARLAWSVSLVGVPQQVITPSYLALTRLSPTWLVYGWAGLPILVEPDVNLGGELAVGGAWLARAGLGATAALVVDGFYGAGTAETRASFYPVISAQMGLFVNYEVLP
jgi:hypothetical protein